MKSTHEWQALAFPVPRLTWPLRSGFEKPILGCFGRERGADVQHALEHQHKRAFGLLARHLMSFHHAPGHVPCAHLYRRPAALGRVYQRRYCRCSPTGPAGASGRPVGTRGPVSSDTGARDTHRRGRADAASPPGLSGPREGAQTRSMSSRTVANARCGLS